MRASKFLPFTLLIVVLGLAGCETTYILDNIVGNPPGGWDTPGEWESKIQNQMTVLRRQTPFQLGEKAGGQDVRGLTGFVGTNPNRDEVSIEAEALRRMWDEIPRFGGEYEDGFRAGWQEAFGEKGYSNLKKWEVVRSVAQRDFEEGYGYVPGRYDFNDKDTEVYRNGWNLAEEDATPVSGSIFDKDEDSKGGR